MTIEVNNASEGNKACGTRRQARQPPALEKGLLPLLLRQMRRQQRKPRKRGSPSECNWQGSVNQQISGESDMYRPTLHRFSRLD